jgi:uncharacterized protein (DUF1697 family)
MTAYAAFLRGVNLGKRTVKSADLKAALENIGLAKVRTLIASGNVLFETRAADRTKLRSTLEKTLEAAFGFNIGVVLRSLDEIRAMIASNPFAGVDPNTDCNFHVLMFAEPMEKKITIAPVAGDYETARIDDDAIYFVVYKKPDGTYLGGSALGDALRPIEKAHLVTMRNWNTIEKAATK